MLYLPFFLVLEEYEIYSPAMIYRHGESCRVPDLFRKDGLRDKVRHTMAQLARNRGFPARGDGMVRLMGQRAVTGWFGWRWLSVLSEDIDRDEIMQRLQALSDEAPSS